MSNFKRMHIIAGIVAILCLVFMFPRCWEVFNANWQRGIGFIGGVAVGGYMFGCVLGLLVNLIPSICRKIKISKTKLMIFLGTILLIVSFVIFFTPFGCVHFDHNW